MHATRQVSSASTAAQPGNHLPKATPPCAPDRLVHGHAGVAFALEPPAPRPLLPPTLELPVALAVAATGPLPRGTRRPAAAAKVAAGAALLLAGGAGWAGPGAAGGARRAGPVAAGTAAALAWAAAARSRAAAAVVVGAGARRARRRARAARPLAAHLQVLDDDKGRDELHWKHAAGSARKVRGAGSGCRLPAAAHHPKPAVAPLPSSPALTASLRVLPLGAAGRKAAALSGAGAVQSARACIVGAVSLDAPPKPAGWS